MSRVLPVGFAREPWLVWAICTIARSGSSWLSQLVESTNVLGRPLEYLLHWPHCCTLLGLPNWTPFEQYISCLLRHRSTPNGVFAIKGSFDELQPFLALFPSAPCVWLLREDKLAQAVSWHRAMETGLWHLTDAMRRERPFEFSLEKALAFYDEILRREWLWREFFAARDVKPLVLTYETLSSDPLAAVRQIAAYVGVDLRLIQQVSSPLCIIRDESTAACVQQLERAVGERNARELFGAAGRGAAGEGRSGGAPLEVGKQIGDLLQR